MGRAGVPAALALLASAVLASEPGQRQAPFYSAQSVVNLATGRAGDLTPNTLAVIYGTDLSSSTRARGEVDPAGHSIPYVLPGTGVTVKVNGLLAGIEFASPEAVVFIVPPDLLPGPARIVLTRNSLNGPVVQTVLQAVAPALLPLEEGWLLARHAATLEWVSADKPAARGEDIIFYCTGLGPTVLPLVNRSPAAEPSEIKGKDGLHVFLDGAEVDRESILYAGITVGAAGIYEIRARLPAWIGSAAAVRISLGGRWSQDGLKLHVEEGPAQPGGAAARFKQ